MIAPIERVKYIFVTSNRLFTFAECWKEAGSIVRETGVRKLWRGNLMNCVRIFPYSSIVGLLAVFAVRALHGREISRFGKRATAATSGSDTRSFAAQ